MFGFNRPAGVSRNRAERLSGQPRPPIVKFGGDSMTAAAFGGSVSLGETYSISGFATWAMFEGRRCCLMTPASNHGVSGETSVQIAARRKAMLADRPAALILLSGANDISAPIADSIAAKKAIYDDAYRAGVTVIVILTLQRVSLTSAQFGRISQLQNYDRAQRLVRPNFHVIDCSQDFIDVTTGSPKTTMVPSGDFHPNPYGAKVIGARLATLLRKLFPTEHALFNNRLDIFHASDNQTGNLLGTAGLFEGTGGSITNTGSPGVLPTGQLATGWSVNGANMPAGVTIALSKGTMSDGRPAQVITFGGSHSSVSGNMNLNITSPGFHANCVSGERLRSFAEMEFDAGIQNISAFSLLLNTATPAGNPIAQDMAGNNTMLLPPIASGGIANPPDIVLPGNPTTCNMIARIILPPVSGTQPVSGVFRIASAEARKVAA